MDPMISSPYSINPATPVAESGIQGSGNLRKASSHPDALVLKSSTAVLPLPSCYQSFHVPPPLAVYQPCRTLQSLQTYEISYRTRETGPPSESPPATIDSICPSFTSHPHRESEAGRNTTDSNRSQSAQLMKAHLLQKSGRLSRRSLCKPMNSKLAVYKHRRTEEQKIQSDPVP
jgi:hypothetical protein